MKNWFAWATNANLRAALDYTMNGGRMNANDAEDSLNLAILESKRLIEKLVGGSFYAQFFPSSRHGDFWDTEYPHGVVDHYTAGVRASGTVKWFSDRPRGEGVGGSSAHAVIDRNGAIIIIIDPILYIAWHAKKANFSHVGIEHVNAGLLRKEGNKFYWQEQRPYPDARVAELQKINGKFWEPYYTPQIVSNIIFKRWLIESRPDKMVREHFVDHQQVDPTRKIDCGPLWPLDGINDLVFSGAPIREMSWLEKKYLTQNDVEDFKVQVHKKLANKATDLFRTGFPNDTNT